MKAPQIFVSLAACLAATSYAAESPKLTHEQLEQNTRLQIFLDNANFGPGKIDGRQGEFTQKALALYRKSRGTNGAGDGNAATSGESQKLDMVQKVGPAEKKGGPEEKESGESKKAQAAAAPVDVSGLDLSGVDPIFTTYTITEEDAAAVGDLPKETAAQAKAKRLPYATLAEGIAERFHCDIDFLKELNLNQADKLKAGDTVTVPNVKPFELSAVKDLKAGSAVEATAANDLENDEEKAPMEAKSDSKDEGSALSVRVGVKEEMLEVYSGDKIVAAFPVTIGSKQTASPTGKWKVSEIAKMPNFRYDEKMLREGERSSDFHMLPPGPNNPVGVVWIALNKKGIGIHGTNDPDSIGRSASHGCIRLANWDVVKVAEMVKKGVPVVVE